MEARVNELERQLNDFDPQVRSQALDELVALLQQGEVVLPETEEIANMHCHTFFSYNGYGYSPTALAWLAKRQGIKLMGIVDFDVLDGVSEFLGAADRVRLRGSAGMETRVYVPEFADRVINSPGEPGICYHMGIGFTESRVPPDAAEARATLQDMQVRAAQRNRGMVDRINAYLEPVVIDYARDVLPLTPGGNATERHMCAAYVQAAERTVDEPVSFWASKLHVPPEQVAEVIDSAPDIQGLIRAKLMKQGGVGYVQPGPETFPTVDEVNAVITASGALPCITWLNGLSAGEQAADELFDLMIGKGAVALNIIPDRNWNIDNPADKALKLQNLYDVVRLAQDLDLPVHVGTEMNAYGNKLVDDFDVPELAPVREAFLDGAYFIYGHTLMARALASGYQSDWAAAHLPTRQARNRFYTALGRRVPPGPAGLAELREVGVPGVTPDVILSRF